jgi:meiotically up-regulated gene 157 (Mug157) protein
MPTGWMDRLLEPIFGSLHEAWLDYPAVQALLRHTLIDALARAVTWPDGVPYVVTGDIPAMWLRDSSGQIEPYIRWVLDDPALDSLVRGVITRQAANMVRDPYANAFNPRPTGRMTAFWDRTEKNPWVFERKFAIDSLAYPIRLWWLYWQKTGNSAVVHAVWPAVQTMVAIYEIEAHHQQASSYRFRRDFAGRTNNLARGPVPDVGLIWSGFRPSDDANRLYFHVPGQMMAAVALDMIREWSGAVTKDADLAARCQSLSTSLLSALADICLIMDSAEAPYWAYEIDGRGQQLFMDDANVPSLLSAPFLFFCHPNHPIYQATRGRVLSTANPYWYQGQLLSGVGSPHTPRQQVWPLAVIIEALTDTDRERARGRLNQVANADAGTRWVHESVHVNRPHRFSRPWFGWANALFAEAALDLAGLHNPKRPPLLPDKLNPTPIPPGDG